MAVGEQDERGQVGVQVGAGDQEPGPAAVVVHGLDAGHRAAAQETVAVPGQGLESGFAEDGV